ncbi:MAG: alpha/beta fold hydrolase [Myxococcales bacterium]|nr:alpha/beta fold hydrolase [Myxococcales bacterium]
MRALVCLSLVLSGLGCSRWLYPVTERAASVSVLPTGDGWHIALHRFPPASGATPRHLPVVVCHGVTSNRRNWDLTDRLSFPAHLARAGFDVYVLELRGSGVAGRGPLFGGPPPQYTLDDYATVDVPVAIEAVRARTGAPAVHWVGHSMGGIVMYVYLQRIGGDAVRSVTAVGSPPYVLLQSRTLAEAVDLLPVAGFFFDTLPVGLLSEAAAPVAWPSRLPEQHLLWNDANMEPATARALAAHGTHGISVGVMEQMAASRDGHLRSADGAIDYTAGLAGVRTPIFFVAGSVDHLAPPATLIEGYRRLGAADKRVEIVGRANGYRDDYGHIDLVMGRHAPDEVYPLLAEWILRHD